MKDEYETREEARARRKIERAQAAKLVEDDHVIRSIMSTISGRRWMRELFELTHLFHTSFSTEALLMAAREGERNIGLQVLAALMRACPEAYVQMMREQNAGSPDPLDRRDPDDDRNYDSAGRWIGDGDDPEGDE